MTQLLRSLRDSSVIVIDDDDLWEKTKKKDEKNAKLPITGSSILGCDVMTLLPPYHSHFDEFSGGPKASRMVKHARHDTIEATRKKQQAMIAIFSSQRGCEMYN